MTEWQWKVIIALVRLTLNNIGVYLYPDIFSKQIDIQQLNEALEREKK
jgi:hypothetical protein